MDFSNLSLNELRQLQDEISKQMKKREHAELALAREKILAIAQGVGVSIKDLVGTGARMKSGIVAVRYRNPNDSSLQWSGRGRQPNWVKAWTDDGKSMDSLKV